MAKRETPVWVLVAYTLGACSSATTAQTNGPTEQTTQMVGPGGGIVRASDGAQLTIPQGALANEVAITIAPNERAPALSQAHALAVAHRFGPEGQTFLKPVQVTLSFGILPAGVPTSAVLVYSAPQGSSAYEPLVSSAGENGQVTAQTTHFSNMYPAYADNVVAKDAESPSEAATTCPSGCGVDGAAGSARQDASGGAGLGGGGASAFLGVGGSAAPSGDSSTNSGSGGAAGDATPEADGSANQSGDSSMGMDADSSSPMNLCSFDCKATGQAPTSPGAPANYSVICGVTRGGQSYALDCAWDSNTAAVPCLCHKDGSEIGSATTSDSACQTELGRRDAFQRACGVSCNETGTSLGEAGDPEGDAAADSGSVEAGACEEMLACPSDPERGQCARACAVTTMSCSCPGAPYAGCMSPAGGCTCQCVQNPDAGAAAPPGIWVCSGNGC